MPKRIGKKAVQNCTKWCKTEIKNCEIGTKRNFVIATKNSFGIKMEYFGTFWNETDANLASDYRATEM
jgi:hypothetical protein